MINFNKMTIKAQEAAEQALALASEKNQQQIEPEHFLIALLKQEDGLVKPLLQKAGVNVNALEAGTDDIINSLPTVSGSGQQYFSPDCNKALEKAFKIIKDFGDE